MLTTSEQSLRDGRLDEALVALQSEIRADPADPKKRVFLFQLLALLGQWERALTQLGVLKEMDASALPMIQMCGDAIRCEALRTDVFNGRRTPLILGQPDAWLAALLESLRLAGDGHRAEAGRMRRAALEDAPPTCGAVDGVRFEWIADADTRLGPVLEVILNGRYYWVPFHRVREVRIDAPSDLRDKVWMPAHFVWANGGDHVGMIPTRYVGTDLSSSDDLRLARRTEWLGEGDDLVRGLGQRMLATSEGDYALLDIRLIQLEAAEPAVTPESSDGA